MNPEFERNVWLELTPLRLIVMCAVLAFAFFAAALSDGTVTPGAVARVLFVVIVVVWGTHNAARSVLGEIRDRTWDGQRLSSLDPATMMWGKLFGSTVFNWFGGFLCLVVIAADAFERSGVLSALWELVFWIAMGVIAQAASLLASLIAARRRQGRTGFEIFLFQVVGLAAAVAVWAIAYPDGPNIGIFAKTDMVTWWDLKIPKTGFYLASLAVFTGWILAGCYRQMRLELKLVNGPWLWLGFLVFTGLYAAGFGECVAARADAATCRLTLAAITMASLAYITVLLEPKSRVQLRWLAGAFAGLRIGTFFTHLQSWMMSYLAAVVLTVALLVHLGLAGQVSDLASTGAMLGFLTRDMGLVLLLNMLARRRGGDLMAIAVLVALYGLLPSIVGGLHYLGGQALFLPHQTDPLWFSPAAAWIEAVAVWIAAVTRIALNEPKAG